MNCSFPILLIVSDNDCTARPLLFPTPKVCDRKRDKAIFQLESEMENELNSLIVSEKTQEALRRLRSPLFRLFEKQIDLDQSKLFLSTWIVFVHWKEGETEFLMAPFLEKFFFTVPKGQSAEEYTTEALQIWIRGQKEERDVEEIKVKLDNQTRLEKLEIATGTLVLSDGLVPPAKTAEQNTLDLLRAEGRNELRAIGREHRFFPDGPVEPVPLEKIARIEDRLQTLLTGQERKSAILLGDAFSGRTRLIESVLCRIDRERNCRELAGEPVRNDNPGPTAGWTLAPGAMIAGMSVSGQWEHRCRAIFEYASHKDLILRFEPFLGFLETGKTVHGGLSIADVLRSELTRERFRAVIELTPEELRLLREKDRMLVRRFEIIEMPVLSEDQEYEIALRTWQANEYNSGCYIPPLVLQTLIQMTKYFEPEKAAPGRVCRWIHHLFKKFPEQHFISMCMDTEDSAKIGTDHLINFTLWEYQKISGHDVSFFLTNVKSQRLENAKDKKNKPTPRERIIEELAQGLVGQRQALECLADTTLKIRTHLNDLSRPAGSFLFVGPTGVGKTEAAKQLARVLFGSDEEALIRFDANELTTPWSVAALLGGGHREGTLVSAVRMRPNCVLLFDEIEKAHPDLADLLLQLLGEGRLTDGFGRVVSFAQCVIIFTSNLGARDAERFTGFDTANRFTGNSYDRAVRDFFRPEWLNRLDAIVPFERLDKTELATIAHRMIESVKDREGFRKRDILLNITPSTISFLTDRIGDVRWGARGVGRMLEKEFVTPMAAFLAETKSECLSVLETNIHDGKIDFLSCELSMVQQDLLLERLDKEGNIPAMREELAVALRDFLGECKTRYLDVFPPKNGTESEEERHRRFIFCEECDQLIREIFLEEKNRGSDLHSDHKARLIEKKSALRPQDDDRSCGARNRRVNLSANEWDEFLWATYHQTSDQIAAKLDAAQHRIVPFDFEQFYPFFLAFGPHKKKREGAIQVLLMLGGNSILESSSFNSEFDSYKESILEESMFPDWYPEAEYSWEMTPNGLYWRKIVCNDAVLWSTFRKGTRLNYNEFFLGTYFPCFELRQTLRFDPDTQTPEEVVAHWERDPARTWGPVSDILYMLPDPDVLLQTIPVTCFPESILAILRRYLGDGGKDEKNSGQTGENRGKEATR